MYTLLSSGGNFRHTRMQTSEEVDEEPGEVPTSNRGPSPTLSPILKLIPGPDPTPGADSEGLCGGDAQPVCTGNQLAGALIAVFSITIPES